MNLLLDSAFKSTFILLAAWIATALLRNRSADVRHRIWLTAILATAAMPLAMLTAPALPSMQIAVAAPINSVPLQAMRVVRAFPWMFAVWVLGTLFVLARLAVGIARIAWITRHAEVRNGVRYSDRISSPLTWGFFRPAIVMPATAGEWSDVAIRHEQAHIERHDWLWQTVARIATAVFWFHPLMWLACARLRHEAELAVDDRVLTSGADPAEYASQLLAVAKSILRPVPAASVAMVRTSALEHRVRAILDGRRPRLQASWLARVAIVALAAAIVFPLAAFQDSTVHKMGEKGLKSPRLLSKVEPEYTQEARDAKIQGTVALRCVINENGQAENIEVVRSLDSGLDNQAVVAVSQWHFAPGEKDGNPVRVLANIEVNFRLQ
jgi:TonB family protein